MTDDSTAGGGLKLFRPTFMMWSILAHICALTERREYSLSPGLAKRRSANSRWNIRIHIRGAGERARSLNVSGEEICVRELKLKRDARGF